VVISCYVPHEIVFLNKFDGTWIRTGVYTVFALMAVAGISWGIYSLRGRGSASPVAVITDNF
jgi:hypothetical protein